MYFNRCSICGAYLDPGEHCDCQNKKEEIEELRYIESEEHEDEWEERYVRSVS